MVSAAVYQLKRKKLPVRHPVNSTYNVKIGEVRSQGFKLEARGRVGQRHRQKVPAYTLYDAIVSNSTGPWRFALNANNLTDKRYVAVCQSACSYGEPRRIIGSVSYRW